MTLSYAMRTRCLRLAAPLMVLIAGLGPIDAVAQETPIPLRPASAMPASREPGPTAASSSLLASPNALAGSTDVNTKPHNLRAVSMFAIAPAESRVFHEHDLIQIIVRETVSAKSKHELETDKSVSIKGQVSQWPDLRLDNLLKGIIQAGSTATLPLIDAKIAKSFEGEGEYKRTDDFTARLTAEVLQILPNGNLILESHTSMKQDDEEFTLKVTGICRPDDVTPVNTILSNQLHDLKVEKINTGPLKNANKAGLFTRIIDTLFAF